MGRVEELENTVKALKEQVSALSLAVDNRVLSRAELKAEADAREAELNTHPEYRRWKAAYTVVQRSRINNGTKTAVERLWVALDKERDARVEWNRVQKQIALYA